jgi:hypothetical protein
MNSAVDPPGLLSTTQSTRHDVVAYTGLSCVILLAAGFYFVVWHSAVLNNSAFAGNADVPWLALHVLSYLTGYTLLFSAFVLSFLFGVRDLATHRPWREHALVFVAVLLVVGAYSGTRFLDSGVWGPSSGPFRYRWYSDSKLFMGVFTASVPVVGSAYVFWARRSKKPVSDKVLTGLLGAVVLLSLTFFFFPHLLSGRPVPHPDGLGNARWAIERLIQTLR